VVGPPLEVLGGMASGPVDFSGAIKIKQTIFFNPLGGGHCSWGRGNPEVRLERL